MKPVKFNDWSELGLKKDIEKINKKLDTQEPIFLSICVEIVLAVGVILIDHLFDTSNVPWYVWLITGTIAILPPLVLTIMAFVKYIQKIISAVNGHYNISSYVDTFDNSICYWAMMCSSFCDLLKDNEKTLSDEEKMFYYQEAHYYINKSIYKLDEMTPVADKIFCDNINEISHKHVISIQRLDIILNLLKNVRCDVEKEVQSVNGYDIWKTKQTELSAQYDKIINRFLKKIKEHYSYKFEWDNPKKEIINDN